MSSVDHISVSGLFIFLPPRSISLYSRDCLGHIFTLATMSGRQIRESPTHGGGWLSRCCGQANLGLLVDPVELSRLVADHLTLLEPESNLLLGVLDRVGAVADVAADVDGEVATDGARGGGQGVGGAEEDCCRYSVSIGPDKSSNGKVRYAINEKRREKSSGKLLYVPRPVLTASRPSQTMAQMGPDIMSVQHC